MLVSKVLRLPSDFIFEVFPSITPQVSEKWWSHIISCERNANKSFNGACVNWLCLYDLVPTSKHSVKDFISSFFYYKNRRKSWAIQITPYRPILKNLISPLWGIVCYLFINLRELKTINDQHFWFSPPQCDICSH